MSVLADTVTLYSWYVERMNLHNKRVANNTNGRNVY